MPEALRKALELQIQSMNHLQLIRDAQTLSMRYRTQNGTGERLSTKDTEAAAYAVSRMPATYGAVFTALEHTLASADRIPESLLDAGAGTGAATWAADAILDLKSVICLEREDAMHRIGEAMMREGSRSLQSAKWIHHDINTGKIPQKADLIIASYVLNEMTDESRMEAAEKLWDATDMILLLVEPGTPVGFSHLREARKILQVRGAHIAAPCAHEGECTITQNDWCHFTCRVARSRLHRQFKGGDSPFEDEKFAYLALTREECHRAAARVLRHPQIHSGYVTLDICTRDGIQKITRSKKDGEQYKQARKAKAGDSLV